MNRRDTIIVAALVNAGLLIVMFVSALKDHEREGPVALEKAQTDLMTNERIAFNEPKKIIGDEVDAVLKQYTQQDPLQTPAAISTAPVAVSFVEDLTAVSLPVVATSETQVQEAAPGWIEVKVKKGDVLEKLARQHHSSVAGIMKLNNLSSTQLKIGQVLKISTSASAPVAVKTEVAPVESVSKFYTVKPGDSPWTIAVKNHMKVEELLKLNNMSEDKAKKLRPGDQIRIR